MLFLCHVYILNIIYNIIFLQILVVALLTVSLSWCAHAQEYGSFSSNYVYDDDLPLSNDLEEQDSPVISSYFDDSTGILSGRASSRNDLQASEARPPRYRYRNSFNRDLFPVVP